MNRSPLGLFKSKEDRARKRAKHDANVNRRAELHREKAFAGADKKNQIQQAIDAISNQV